MQTDPYAVGFRPGKFRMGYMGREDGWYVITIYQRHHVGLDACMMDRDVFEWLFEEVGPKAYLMGRSGATMESFPKLKLCEGDGHNTNVLLKNFEDVILFDQHFGITGIKALMEGR